ncbi:hypothetical protein F511_20689 [Dorcoceras hygrometricum]|uniref:Uncharacterized protein n=1 Tax=Dorcoceras hygrometricum TaxID=472368 RepID=A0A2Z7CS98_9LAMI|nr:hypothetical protein F511_20689 [Dorcoceras hygrometricum]
MSHIGPKTSRAARDRPEPNPRRNQPSRHRRIFFGASPERWPAGGRHHEFSRAARAPPSQQARGQRAHHCAAGVQLASTKRRHGAQSSGQQARAQRLATMRAAAQHHRPPIARPARDVEVPLTRRERPPCATRRASLGGSTAQRLRWTRPALRGQSASRARSCA